MSTSKPFRFSALIFLLLTLSSTCAVGENRYVAITGDDSNPGTRQLPWRTLRAACVRLEPGDRLLVGPGDYIEFDDDGVDNFRDTIFVRTIGTAEENFQYKPFVGDPNSVTVIQAWKKRQMPRIFGHFDVRGSYLRIAGLEVVGDPDRSVQPGIAFYSSHDVACVNNVVHNHGGGGIAFTQCDIATATGNICFNNATTNPGQTSGISSYQPIRRSPSSSKVGVRFRFNVCFDNRNEVPDPSGNITDGNGIAIDDHYYTQTNSLIEDAIAGLPDSEGVGTPVIETRTAIVLTEDGGEPETVAVPLPYDRKTLVTGNLCFRNGGRGIHFFLSDNAVATNNFLCSNLRSSELLDTLPIDPETGSPFFLFGEMSSSDSTNLVFRRNLLVANSLQTASGNEYYFSLQPIRPRGNLWRKNIYLNLCRGPLFSLAGIENSESSLVKDTGSSSFWPFFGFGL